MLKNVTVYYNTGFGGNDYPANPSVLNSAQSRTYSDVYFVREDLDKPSIKINAPYSELRDVDYLKLSDVDTNEDLYYFCVPKALAKNTTILYLDLHGTMSCGGASELTYVSGWQTRGHIDAADDVLYGNTAPEDWSPSQPLITASSVSLDPPSTNIGKDIVLSNIDLVDLAGTNELQQDVIEGIVSGDTEASMYFPAVKSAKRSTVFFMWDFIQSLARAYSPSQTTAYLLNDAIVQRALTKLYSSGQLQLQNSYYILDGWIGAITQVSGTNPEIVGINSVHSIEDSGIPHMFTYQDYTIKNKKCYAMYREFVLINQNSGNMDTETPEQLYDGNDATISVWEWSDPSVLGKPYARFKYLKKSPLQFSFAVEGTQWNSSQIVMEGASGSAWNALTRGFEVARLSQSQTEAELNRSFQLASQRLTEQRSKTGYEQAVLGNITGTTAGVIGGFMSGNLGGAAQAAAQGLTTAMFSNQNRSYELQAERINREEAAARYEFEERARNRERNAASANYLKSTITAPTVLFTPSVNLSSYGYNRFSVYEIRPTKEDIISLDKYFQRYGYSGLHLPLTKNAFTRRQYYNYVQAGDINFKSTLPLRVREKAIAELNNGGRYWRVLPDSSYYDQN